MSRHERPVRAFCSLVFFPSREHHEKLLYEFVPNFNGLWKRMRKISWWRRWEAVILGIGIISYEGIISKKKDLSESVQTTSSTASLKQDVSWAGLEQEWRQQLSWSRSRSREGRNIRGSFSQSLREEGSIAFQLKVSTWLLMPVVSKKTDASPSSSPTTFTARLSIFYHDMFWLLLCLLNDMTLLDWKEIKFISPHDLNHCRCLRSVSLNKKVSYLILRSIIIITLWLNFLPWTLEAKFSSTSISLLEEKEEHHHHHCLTLNRKNRDLSFLSYQKGTFLCLLTHCLTFLDLPSSDPGSSSEGNIGFLPHNSVHR